MNFYDLAFMFSHSHSVTDIVSFTIMLYVYTAFVRKVFSFDPARVEVIVSFSFLSTSYI